MQENSNHTMIEEHDYPYMKKMEEGHVYGIFRFHTQKYQFKCKALNHNVCISMCPQNFYQ